MEYHTENSLVCQYEDMNTNLSINVEKQNNDIRKTKEIDFQDMDIDEKKEGINIDTSLIIIERITYSICALTKKCNNLNLFSSL